VVIAAVNIWRECIFAGVPTWAMPAIMAKCHGLGECNIEP
jgi:hypothetical protein